MSQKPYHKPLSKFLSSQGLPQLKILCLNHILSTLVVPQGIPGFKRKDREYADGSQALFFFWIKPFRLRTGGEEGCAATAFPREGGSVTTETPDTKAIIERLDRLEKQNRRLRRLALLALALGGTVVFMAQAARKDRIVEARAVLTQRHERKDTS